MKDIWSFLLQTLTAAGVAGLVVLLKLLFRDKLSPRWQFAAWSVPALALLLPAGVRGRYVLFNWPLWVETLRSICTGRYDTVTSVALPVPLLPDHPPADLWDWLFLVYLTGVVVLLGKYLYTYLRLRSALKRGVEPSGERLSQLTAVAERYQLPTCPAVVVPGLPTAFLCGVVSPVLVLPEEEVDDKVLLHELLHLKHRDPLWGILICLLRCLHWCDPFLWLCADWAGNDLEALCDQRVLEALAGEERRDYGRILLSMADETYARTPGTSSLANGGRNIARRIEAIARFKLYPAGMKLVSGCILLVLALPILLGTAQGVPAQRSTSPYAKQVLMASARVGSCTTPGGAIDSYAKALLSGNAQYRALCAPLDQQADLAPYVEQNDWDLAWLTEAPDWLHEEGCSILDRNSGYTVYQLAEQADGSYTGLLSLTLRTYLLDWVEEGDTYNYKPLLLQPIQVEEQDGRWVVLGDGPFTLEMNKGNSFAPYDHSYTAGPVLGVQLEVKGFTRLQVNDLTRDQQTNGFFSYGSSNSYFDTAPQPSREMNLTFCYELYASLADPASEGCYLYLSAFPLDAKAALSAPTTYPGDHPEAGSGFWPDYDDSEGPWQGSGGSSTGEIWDGRTLRGFSDDLDTLDRLLVGTSLSLEESGDLPAAFSVSLTVQGETELFLLTPTTPEEGGDSYDGQ